MGQQFFKIKENKVKKLFIIPFIFALLMLSACNDNSFYCDRCGKTYTDGNKNYITIGSVDVTLCDDHKAELLNGTEKVGVDEMLTTLDSKDNGTVKLRTLSQDNEIKKSENKFYVGTTEFNSKEELKEYITKHFSTGGYVYMMK